MLELPFPVAGIWRTALKYRSTSYKQYPARGVRHPGDEFFFSRATNTNSSKIGLVGTGASHQIKFRGENVTFVTYNDRT